MKKLIVVSLNLETWDLKKYYQYIHYFEVSQVKEKSF